MKNQREYWDNVIREWTAVSYNQGRKRISLVESLANLFRKPIAGRLDAALDLVGPRIKGKTLVDLGCGLGDFCFQIIKYKPKKVIGIDISKVAVVEATDRAVKGKTGNKVKFIQKDLSKDVRLPSFDIAVGLGFIDYFEKKQLRKLISAVSGRLFLFSVFEKKLTFRTLVHGIYMKFKQCPGAFKYTRKEIMSLVPPGKGIRFLTYKGLLFITNLPYENEK